MMLSGFLIAIGSARATTSDTGSQSIQSGAVDAAVGELPAGGDAPEQETFPPSGLPAEDQWSARDTSNNLLSNVLSKAETMVGVPYLWGGNTPEEGLDCSGFVRYVYEKAAGIVLPRLSAQISRSGSAMAQRDLHPGDLVFFNTPRGRATHVGIYIGEQQFIHAPKTGEYIRIESMRSTYWRSQYYGARRIA
ncbi:C40 family peptidase [Caballeronia sp. KNU42]